MVENKQDFPFVEEDSDYAMACVVDHLAGKGHTRIACIAPPPLSVMFSSVRLRAVRKHMELIGLSLPDEMVCIGSFDQKDGFAQTHKLLDLPHPPPTASSASTTVLHSAPSMRGGKKEVSP